MGLRLTAAALLLVLPLSACGGDDPGPETPPADPTSSSPASDPTLAEPPETSSGVMSEVLGEEVGFQTTVEGAGPLDTGIDGRECLLAEVLSGSCRAASGAGGAFVVTAEGSIDSPGVWNVVVRCGLDPALPSASAQGEFTPVIADLGLAAYGEVIGVHLMGGTAATAALVYQPEGAECPVVWGLGQVDSSSLFTGGTDALNGSERPIAFRDARGADACAVADGQGGITVGKPRGGDCS